MNVKKLSITMYMTLCENKIFLYYGPAVFHISNYIFHAYLRTVSRLGFKFTKILNKSNWQMEFV